VVERQSSDSVHYIVLKSPRIFSSEHEISSESDRVQKEISENESHCQVTHTTQCQTSEVLAKYAGATLITFASVTVSSQSAAPLSLIGLHLPKSKAAHVTSLGHVRASVPPASTSPGPSRASSPGRPSPAC
jgi:hypothetical protein